MSLQTVKVTEEAMKKLGCANPAEFQAALDKFFGTADANASAVTTLTETVQGLDGRLKKIEGGASGAAPDIKSIVDSILAHADFTAKLAANLEAAKTAGATAGSAKASEALGAVGRPPVAASPVTEAANPEAAKKLETLLAEGKFEEAYAVDKAGQKDFVDKESYAAYMRANKGGKVRVVTRA